MTADQPTRAPSNYGAPTLPQRRSAEGAQWYDSKHQDRQVTPPRRDSPYCLVRPLQTKELTHWPPKTFIVQKTYNSSILSGKT